MRVAKADDDRQQNMHRRLVHADNHPPAPDFLQLPHRLFGLILQSCQSLGVVEQDGARLGQLPGFGRAVEQPLAELDLEPSDCLADGRLCAVQAGSGAREAALGGHHLKDVQLVQFHGGAYIIKSYQIVIIITLTLYASGREVDERASRRAAAC